MTQHKDTPSFLFENQAYELGYQVVVGLDEAGRGPLAGPVVACACYIIPDAKLEGVQDSKLLDPVKRRKLYEMLIEHPQVVYAIGVIDASGIDKTNILQASMQAMLLAVKNLKVQTDYILVDGSYFPKTTLPGLALIRGDQRSLSIAAASIIAKEVRDDMMREYHKQWPTHGFDVHKGYATKEHITAVKAYGVTPIHRLSFEPIRSLIKY
ncbi:MAG: ribonuclease HII [Chlamydiota bacterium]